MDLGVHQFEVAHHTTGASFGKIQRLNLYATNDSYDSVNPTGVLVEVGLKGRRFADGARMSVARRAWNAHSELAQLSQCIARRRPRGGHGFQRLLCIRVVRHHHRNHHFVDQAECLRNAAERKAQIPCCRLQGGEHAAPRQVADLLGVQRLDALLEIELREIGAKRVQRQRVRRVVAQHRLGGLAHRLEGTRDSLLNRAEHNHPPQRRQQLSFSVAASASLGDGIHARQRAPDFREADIHASFHQRCRNQPDRLAILQSLT